MFNSTILDVAIGMIFVFLLLSLMCSAASEIIELMLKKRAIDLERGIRELLAPGSKSGSPDIVQQLYDHSLVNNLFGGSYGESRIGSSLRTVLRTHLPSYIPAKSFALALMDLVGTTRPADEPGKEGAADTRPSLLAPEPTSGASGATVTPTARTAPTQVVVLAGKPGEAASLSSTDNAAVVATPAASVSEQSLASLRSAIIDYKPLEDVSRRALITLLDASGNDVAKLRENIENWYDSSMDRVSSWYKRRAQITIFILGLFVAMTVNVDTITVAKRLSTDKALRDSLVAAADAYAKANAPASATPTPEAETKTTPKSGAGASAPESEKSSTPGSETSTKPAAESVKKPAGGESDTSTADSKTLPACAEDPNSDDCRTARACEDPNSTSCKRAKDLQEACKEPGSVDCQRARALEEACKDEDSPKCKYVATQQQIQSLGLPIGWDQKNDPKRYWTGWTWKGDKGGWWEQVMWHWLGWLLTALAISLGAPFWFDLLNKFIVVRSAVKPHEKSPEEKSKG